MRTGTTTTWTGSSLNHLDLNSKDLDSKDDLGPKTMMSTNESLAESRQIFKTA